MSANLYNVALMNVASAPGAGSAIALGTAVTIGGVTFMTFAQAGIANSTVVDYSIQDVNGVEVGTATYSTTGTQLTGRTPTISSAGVGTAINASSAATVALTPRAETYNDASLFRTGTLADPRLSSNVPLKNTANVFSAPAYAPGSTGWQLTGSINVGGSNGGGITILDGTAGYGFYTNSFGANLLIGYGTTSSGLSAILTLTSGGNLTLAGKLADASLSSNVPLKNSNNAFTAQNTYAGNFAVNGGNAVGWQIVGNYGSGVTVSSATSTVTYFLSQDGGFAGFSLNNGGYAINVGLNASTQVFAIGGWSDGNRTRFTCTSAGDGYFDRSLGIAVAPSGVSGEVRANNAPKAWVNVFSLAVSSGFNVASISNNGTGDLSVNFSSALPNANYAACVTVNSFSNTQVNTGGNIYATSQAGAGIGKSTSSLRILTGFTNTGVLASFGNVNVIVTGTN